MPQILDKLLTKQKSRLSKEKVVIKSYLDALPPPLYTKEYYFIHLEKIINDKTSPLVRKTFSHGATNLKCQMDSKPIHRYL